MIWFSVLGALITVLISAAFSGMETGVYSLERVRLQMQAAAGNPLAARLLALISNPSRTVCTILVVNNAVNYGVAFFCGDVLKRLVGPGFTEIELELINTAWVAPTLFVFGELLPKDLFLRYPTSLVARVYPVYRLAERGLVPVVRPLLALMELLMGEAGDEGPLLARRGIRQALTVGDESEALTEPQRAMVSRVFSMKTVTVKERMVPWDEVACVPLDAGREQLLAVSGETGRSRLLVRDDDRQVFLGYVNALDAVFGGEGSFRLEDELHQMPSVAPDAPLIEVLQVLQTARRPLARVQRGEQSLGIISSSDIVDLLLQQAPEGRPRDLGKVP